VQVPIWIVHSRRGSGKGVIVRRMVGRTDLAAAQLTSGSSQTMNDVLARSRHDARIDRIVALANAVNRPISRDYLVSCDVRALPVLQEWLERSHGRGRPPRGLEFERAHADSGRRQWWGAGR
jgi:hypothetical protein